MPGTDLRRSSALASSRCHPESATRSQAEAACVERVFRSKVLVSDWLACTDDQAGRKSSSRLTKGEHDSAARERGAHRRTESGRELLSTASAARTSGTLLTHQGFQLHVSSHCRTPYLQAGTGGGALLASDGSVLQLGPTRRARAPLRRLPPAEVPYIINSLGAPYGVSDSGELLPLAVSSRGELWCGPDGHPLMLQPCPQHTTPPAAPIMQVVMASGSPMWLSTGAQVGCRVRRDVERSPVAPAVALAMVDLTSGQDLVDSQTGQRLKVDPASLELLGPGGRPAYDQRGRPLRLVGTQPPLHPGQQLLPLKPSVGLLAGCVLVLVLVAGLVLVAATCGCLGGLLTLLLAAAAWAALAGLAACTPAAVPLPHPVLLNVRGRPLRDARGQRLCLTSPDVTGQRHVVTDTGDMVCVSVDGAAGQPAKLVRSLPFLRGGGSAHDVLVDAEGRPLLGRQGAILRILQDAHQHPLLSPLGLPLALTLAGTPCLGPDGAPLSLTPDGKVLLGSQGQPLLGPAGRLLVLGPQGDLRYLEGCALRGPGKQRVYLCANGALSHGLGAGLSLATCPALISSCGGVVAGPAGRPVTRGPWGTLLSYSSRAPWWLWPVDWETAPLKRSRSNTSHSRSNSGLHLSNSGRVRIRRSSAVSSSRRAAPTVLAYAGSVTATMAGSSSTAAMTTLQGGAPAMPRVSSRLRLSSTTNNTGATNRTAARVGGASAATSSSGHVCYVPINGAGVALPSSQAATQRTNSSSSSGSSSRVQAGGDSFTSDATSKPSPRPDGRVGPPPGAVAASVGADTVDAASPPEPPAPVVATEAQGWPAAGQQLVMVLDMVLVLLQLVFLQHPQLASWTQECLAAGRRWVSWVCYPGALLHHTWRTAALAVASDVAGLVTAPWSQHLQSVVSHSMMLTAGLLLVSCGLVVVYPHQQYAQAGLVALSTPALAATGQGSTPFLHLRLVAAAASAGLLDRGVSRRECLQLQLLGLGAPQECGQGWACTALVQVLGVAPPAGYPPTLLAAVAHWALWVWPVPQVVLMAGLLTLLCTWLLCNRKAAAPRRTPNSGSSWFTWVLAALVVAAAVCASISCSVLAGGALGAGTSQGQLQATHQQQQATAIQSYLQVVQQVTAGQEGAASAHHPGSGRGMVGMASLEGLEHLLLPTSAAMDLPLEGSGVTAGGEAVLQQQGTSNQLPTQHTLQTMPQGPPPAALHQAEGWTWDGPGPEEDVEASAWLEASQEWYPMDGDNSSDDGNGAAAWAASQVDTPATLLYQLLLAVGSWLQLVPVVLLVLVVCRRMPLLSAPAKPQAQAASGSAWGEAPGAIFSRVPSGKEPSFTKWLTVASGQDPATMPLPCIPEEVQPGAAPSWQVPAVQETPSGQPPWEVASRTTSEADWSVLVEPAAEVGMGKGRRLLPTLGPSSSEGDTTSGSSGSRQVTSSGSRSSRGSSGRPLTLDNRGTMRGYPKHTAV